MSAHPLRLVVLAAFLLAEACLAQSVPAPGRVVAWGDNTYGQTNVPPNLTNVIAIAAGQLHSLALRSDGTVVAWGYNAYGQTNVPSNLKNVVAIAAGNYHSLAVKSDGTVVGWGYDANGQIDVPAGLSNVVAVAAGYYESVALKRDGTVVEWGSNGQGPCLARGDLTNVVAIGAGWSASLALNGDGTLAGWTLNGSVDGSVPSGLTNAVAIAKGYSHSLAIRSDGTVAAWGLDTSGQIDVPPGLTNVVAVAAFNHSLALRSDCTLVGWGYNAYGQANAPADLTNAVAIAAGSRHSLALCQPLPASPPPFIVRQPAPARIPAGASIRFSVGISSVLPVTCQWQFNENALPDGATVGGATTSELTLNGAALTNTGTYSVVVSNVAGVVKSAGAFLSVQPFLTLTAPTNLTLRAGATASLGVALQSVSPMTYQWRFNGADLTDGGHLWGARTATLTITNVTRSNGGTYSVSATNAVGSGVWTAALGVVPFTAPGWRVDNLHAFTAAGDGGHPNELVLGRDGTFYGTTSYGGSNSVPQGGSGDGTLFRFATNGVLTTLYSFTGGSDEADPSGPLVEGTNGLFYGTTDSGINGQNGTVFAASTNGTITTLLTFDWTNGADPQAVTLGPGGKLYGTTYAGGGAWGGVYTLDPANGTFAQLLGFSGANGYYGGPQLTLGTDGWFYGTTRYSSSTGRTGGTLFQMDAGGALTRLYTFSGGPDGSVPAGRLLQTADGSLYGTTSGGGAFGRGTVFRFSAHTGLSTLYSFGTVTNWDGSALDGANPIAGLTPGPDGYLYGLTTGGGWQGSGIVFRISTNGTLATLAWLDTSTGTAPVGRLTLGPDNNFYGVTAYGGANNFGTIFRIVPPPPPAVQAVATADGHLSLAWNALVGQTYQVQFTTGLHPPLWLPLGSPILASGPSLSTTDTLTQAQRFYRVVQVPGS